MHSAQKFIVEKVPVKKEIHVQCLGTKTPNGKGEKVSNGNPFKSFLLLIFFPFSLLLKITKLINFQFTFTFP